MDDAILLVSFDINSAHEHEETNTNDKKLPSEAQMETPERIFDEFFSKHKKSNLNLEKTKLNASETKYTFSFNLPDMSHFQIISINDLSFIHEITLDTDAYVIFINLEDPKTEEKLEYLIRYIVESCCSVETRTCVVGLYKEKILPQYTKQELETLFNDNNLIFEYYQVKYNIDENGHNCIYDIIENKNNNFDKKELDDLNKDIKISEAIEKILISTYENKFGVEFNIFKNKFIKKGSKSINDANSVCNII